jgi:PAS domain S-box-containing protein
LAAWLGLTLRALFLPLSDVTDIISANEINRRVFDNELSPMIMIDDKGRIQRFNTAATNLTGYRESEVGPQPLLNVCRQV